MVIILYHYEPYYTRIVKGYKKAIKGPTFWAGSPPWLAGGSLLLALQGSLKPRRAHRARHSAPEIYTNFDPFPAITEYKRGDTKKNEQKRDHPVDQREWPSQKIPEKIW